MTNNVYGHVQRDTYLGKLSLMIFASGKVTFGAYISLITEVADC